MNSITRGIQAVSVVILVLVAPLPLTVAQEPGREGGSSPAPPAKEELDRMTSPERGGKDVEERIRHFQAKKREKLLQALQLDEATRTRLTQRLELMDQKAEDLRRQRREAVQTLREQAKELRKQMRRGQRNGGGRVPEEAPSAGVSRPDNSALRQALERLYAVEDAMTDLRRERLQVARDLLTPEQQARFYLFGMKFRKEMRERLQREHGGPEGGR
jgi:ssDNA-binding replication factor A large subunit